MGGGGGGGGCRGQTQRLALAHEVEVRAEQSLSIYFPSGLPVVVVLALNDT